MDAEQIVERLDELPGGWLGGRPQPESGQARERGTGAAQGEHFVGSEAGGSVLVPWGVPLCVWVLGVFNLV